MARHRRYKICEERILCGFAGFVCGSVLSYAKLETFKLCFDLERVPWSSKNRIKIVGESRRKSTFVLAKKKMVPGCPLQLALGVRPYTQSTEQTVSKFLK